MLLRKDEQGVLTIGQASHAWISGQLARAWGNDRFGTVAPREEVCLAAEQHDVGMASWDLEPALNPKTGLPYSFMEMPLSVHLRLWREGPSRLIRQSRYAALLAVMHGRRLYDVRDLERVSAEEAEAIRSYIADQRKLEEQLMSSLTAEHNERSARELVARNSQLLWTWDFLSLAVCLEWAPATAREVPTSDGSTDIRLLAPGGPQKLILDPWPFSVDAVEVHCEGQRLNGRFEDEDALHAALAEAQWETLRFKLSPP